MAKTKLVLTSKSIRRAAPEHGQLELWDAHVTGFGLRISSGGARTYIVMRRVGGKLVRRTVGKAPGLEVMPGSVLPDGFYWPEEARERARALLTEMALGRDPGIVRRPRPAKLRAGKLNAKAAPPDGQASEAPAPAEGTFRYVAEKYLASTSIGGGGRLKTKAERERQLKVDLAPWHDRPMAEIRKRDIFELIETKAEKSPIQANRLLSTVKRIFSWAAQRDYIEADPARSVPKPSEEIPRDRVLDEREIGLFWRACDKLDEPADGDDRARGTVGRLLQLALVTGQRRGEVAGLLRSELGKADYKRRDALSGNTETVEADAWIIPPERTKRGNLARARGKQAAPHIVPLSPLAMTLIEDAPERAGSDGKMFNHVFATGAAGDQPPSAWDKTKRRLDELIGREIAEDLDEEYDPAKHSIPPWHFHDLRATFATFIEYRLQVPRPVISRLLNHSEGGGGQLGKSITAGYIRYSYDAEAVDAVNRWAELLEQLCGLNVVTLKGRHAG